MAPEEDAGEPPAKRSRAGKAQHIVLVGMRAAGKTTFGKVAARHLQRRFLDVDHLLEKEVLGGPIPAYVDQHGWAKFREAEAQMLTDLLFHGAYGADAPDGCVISTGGGVVETASALKVLEEHRPVIWIDRHIDDICRCLEGVGSYRPALGSSPQEVYARRKALYEKCSDFVFRIRLGDEGWPALERRFERLMGLAAGTEPPEAALRPANPVAVPIVARDVSGCLADLSQAAAEGAGLVEYRLDKLAGGPEAAVAALPELMRAAKACGLPVVATFRAKWEDPNAGYEGEEGPRFEVLRLAAELGAAFVDVERGAAAAFAAAGGLPAGSLTRLVVSSHDFDRLWPMEELRSLVAELRGLAGPHGVAKIAQMAKTGAEAARMLLLLEEASPQSVVALAMGEVGAFTRFLSPACGAAFTFGCLEGRASAPGQPLVSQLVEAAAEWDAKLAERGLPAALLAAGAGAQDVAAEGEGQPTLLQQALARYARCKAEAAAL